MATDKGQPRQPKPRPVNPDAPVAGGGGGGTVPVAGFPSNPDAPAPNPNPPTNPNPGPVGDGGPVDPPYTPTPGQFATLRALLHRYGLDSLYDTAVGWLVDGTADDEARLNLALRETPEFRTRFRGIFDREQNGFPPISVNEYLQYEDFAFQTMRELGYPPGFYDDPDDFADAIGRNVSTNEFRQRAEAFADAAAGGREEIRNQLALHMGPEVASASDGLSDAELAAWSMDADRALPLLRQRIQAASVSAAGVQAGFGGLSYGEATGLVGRGVTEDAARQAFAALAQQGDVVKALAGEDQGVDRETQLGVVGGEGQALTALETARRRRQGAFQGGGGFATGREGVSGVGSAR